MIIEKPLEIQKFLRGDGSLKDLESDPYNLSIKGDAHGDLVNFKYNQIDSDLSLPICKEARGLILSKRNNWEVVSFPFVKFFNKGNSQQAAKIDWDTAVAEEKADGSCTPLYWYDGEWNVHTLGTINAEGPVQMDESVKRIKKDWQGEKFRDLFWSRWDRIYGRDKLEDLNKDFVYVTELCTDFNTPVTQYEKDRIILLSMRHRPTLQEYDVEEKAPKWFDIRRSWDLSGQSMEEVYEMMESLDPDEEGFVVRDAYWDRVKVKQDSYVQRHQMKSNIIERKNGMVEAIQEGYADDFVSTFDGFEDVYDEVNREINLLIDKLRTFWKDEEGSNVDPDDHYERKNYALKVQEFEPPQARSLLFQRLTGKIDNFREGIKEMKTDKLSNALEQIDK